MMIAQFPVDLLSDIFTRLPAKTLACLKIVCKSWYDIISDDYFVDCHLERSLATKTNRHYIVTTPRLYLQKYAHRLEPLEQNCYVLYSADFDSLENPIELHHPFKNCNTGVWVLGSCRGLVLLHVGGAQTFLLYNPTTQTYNVLPWLHTHSIDTIFAHVDYGFGYDNVSKDYKCVRVFQSLDKEAGFVQCEVMVYSLKTDCWKRVPDAPCYFRLCCCAAGVLVHETINWIGSNSNDVFETIVAFNLKDETFRCLPLPNFHFEESDGLYVGMLDGCLCLLANRYLHCTVWVMKEYGEAGSWIKLFTFGKRQCFNLVKPISYSMDRKRLLITMNLGKLTYIDLETLEATYVTFADWNGGLDAHIYVENLLILDYAEFTDYIGDPPSIPLLLSTSPFEKVSIENRKVVNLG